VLALSAAAVCFPQVQLPAVNLGDTNYEHGFGAPGWLLEEFPAGYTASVLRGAQGNKVPGPNRVTTFSTTTHIALISKQRFMGAWLVTEALQPLVDLGVKLARGTDSRIRGLGDLTVGSGLQWAPRKVGSGVLAQRAMINVGAPTGKYGDDRPLNIGNHFVSLTPNYVFTYEPVKKVEFTAQFYFLWNSANHDPFVGLGIKNMQAGQAVHANYASSYAIFKSVRVGFNGYWLQQLTDHAINGISVADSKERTVGLGSGAQVGGKGLWLRVNSYIETDVRNRPSGIKVTFRISKTLGARQPEP
jgi:anthranilate 1,2-dioxygenase (deaminating, decarboxylating) large subunit